MVNRHGIGSCRPRKGAHGLSIYGTLKYPKDFKHFDYVNPHAPKGGILRLSGYGTFDSFNPFILKGMAAAGSQMIFVTLTLHSNDEAASGYGYLAKTIDIAADRSWVIYHIRPEATFHDGSPITAEDVIYSFTTLVEKGSPQYKATYKDVTKAEALDQRTVKFSFTPQVNGDLAVMVGQFPIFSKAFMEKHGFERADLTPLLANGPYKMGDFKAGHYVTYDRVKNWWGEQLPINVGRHNFDHIRYDYFRDQEVTFEAFKNHTFDMHMDNIAKNWSTGYTFPAVKAKKVLKLEIPNKTPAIMQGFSFNTRRDLFKDRRVREALGMAFDFEWCNAHLWHNLYTRTQSYFDRSPLASRGIPKGEELTLLEPFRKDLPPELFTSPFRTPSTTPPSSIRENLKKAKALLSQAGWHVKNNQLIHEKSGQTFAFEFLLHTPVFERVLQGFINNLKILGIKAHMRIVDPTQYVKMLESYNFDMAVSGVVQSLNPGNEQRHYWHSDEADLPGGSNIAGIKDPVVDHFVELVISASSEEELRTRVRVLDRVLLWGHYLIPNFYSFHTRIAHWNNISHPETFPPYGVDTMTWWSNEPTLKEK